uniref:Metallo-beta-lactamase domain-containing protein n=1 Tax=Trichobilharzia regenti TaxID=157069 RepID=A0AA85IVP5_TRIRE|nr:unnamed protein product [Trichobilharzia regenti]
MSTELPNVPNVSQINQYVVRILGQNPGPRTLQGTNSYLVGDPKSSRVLIDTTIRGPSLSVYLNCLEKEFSQCTNGLPLSAIIITHWHPDHCQVVEDVLKLAYHNSSNNIPVYKCSTGPTLLSLGYYSGQVTNLQDNDTVPIDVQSNSVCCLRAIHTPGHATDHLCFLLEKDNQPVCFFSGDLILGHGSTIVENLDEYMTSLHTVRSILSKINSNNRQQSVTLLPGHGSDVKDALNRVNEYITNRLNRIEKTKKYFLDQSTTDKWLKEGDILRFVYPNIPDNLRFEAINNLRQSLFWLSTHNPYQIATASLPSSNNLLCRMTNSSSENISITKEEFYAMLHREIVNICSVSSVPVNNDSVKSLRGEWEWKWIHTME